MRAWVQGEKPNADLTFLGGLLSEPLPPHGYVQRYHDQGVSLPLLISTDGLAGNHFVTVFDAKDGKIVAAVFVWADERTRLELPEGSYWVRFTSGQKWGGPESLFGPGEACHQVVGEIEMSSSEGIALFLADANTEEIDCGSMNIAPIGWS